MMRIRNDLDRRLMRDGILFPSSATAQTLPKENAIGRHPRRNYGGLHKQSRQSAVLTTRIQATWSGNQGFRATVRLDFQYATIAKQVAVRYRTIC
jgi:hypothetical protein